MTYTTSNWDDVIGLAKDGHVIIGPYKPDGTNWGCDRDVCNGVFVNSSYVYVGSDHFPYVVGCWGPGPEHQYSPTCSNSGCGPGDGDSTNTGEDEDPEDPTDPDDPEDPTDPTDPDDPTDNTIPPDDPTLSASLTVTLSAMTIATAASLF